MLVLPWTNNGHCTHISFISTRQRYLITDCRCDSNEIARDTDWFVCVASRFIVSSVQGSSLRVSAKWLFILRPRGVFEYFISLYIILIELHQHGKKGLNC